MKTMENATGKREGKPAENPTENQMMENKTEEQTENLCYRERIPKEVLEGLPEEVTEQYYLWDQIIKREIELYPRLLFPLIREVFRRDYPEGTKVALLATEYIVREIKEDDGSVMSPIYADITVRIGGRDTYHLECQMNREKGMVLRMLEYDFHIGLTHAKTVEEKEGIPEISLPQSVVLYLYPYQNLPPEEKCRIRFADGSVHEFSVPVVAVQQYSPQAIEDKHLDLLIPFLPARFRPRLKKEEHREETRENLRKDLTECVRECIMVIEREKENGVLTDAEGKDVLDLLSIACAHLLKNRPELDREVQGMILPKIHMMRDDINELEAKLQSQKKQWESEKEQWKNEKEQWEQEKQEFRRRIEELEKRTQK